MHYFHVWGQSSSCYLSDHPLQFDLDLVADSQILIEDLGIYLFFLLFFPLKKIRITYNGLWCDLCDLEIVGSLGNDFIYNIVVILLMLPLPSPS